MARDKEELSCVPSIVGIDLKYIIQSKYKLLSQSNQVYMYVCMYVCMCIVLILPVLGVLYFFANAEIIYIYIYTYICI